MLISHSHISDEGNFLKDVDRSQIGSSSLRDMAMFEMTNSTVFSVHSKIHIAFAMEEYVSLNFSIKTLMMALSNQCTKICKAIFQC